MRIAPRSFTSAAVAAALIFSPTAAAASSASAPASSAWVTLSMLNPAGATALGAAAAQPAAEGYYADRGGFHPPIAVIAVFLAVIALDIWILTRNNHGRGHINIEVPVSPD